MSNCRCEVSLITMKETCEKIKDVHKRIKKEKK